MEESRPDRCQGRNYGSLNLWWRLFTTFSGARIRGLRQKVVPLPAVLSTARQGTSLKRAYTKLWNQRG